MSVLLVEIQDYVLTNAGDVATAVEEGARRFSGQLSDVIVAVET